MQGSALQVPPYFVNVTREGRGQFNWQFAGVPMKKILLHKVLPQKGLTENAAIKEQSQSDLRPSLEILPARCATSPMVAMLRYDDRSPFVSVTTTTERSIWDLQQMELFYLSQAVYQRSMGNRKLCDALLKTIQEDPESYKLDAYVSSALDNFLATVAASGDSCKERLPEFVRFMWDLTMRHIHMMEKRIHKCCCLLAGTNDIRLLLTPNAMVPEDFPYDPKTEAEDSINLQKWFQSKQANGIAEQSANAFRDSIKDPKIVTHIDYEKIVPTLQESRNLSSIFWRRFVPWRTLWQYMLFLDYWGLKKLQNEVP
jgi:hypothetical protein